MTLGEALAQYLLTGASSASAYTRQELHRFTRAIGLERDVEELGPPAVASYAEGVVAAGGDVHGRLAPLKEFLTFLKKKGLTAQSLAPHVKIPRATVRAVASMGADSIAMTEEGMRLLRVEVGGLKAQRGQIVEAIRTAAEDKDFRENAPLDAARESQGKAEGRIREIEETLRRAVIVAVPRDGSRGAQVGATVVLEELGTDKRMTYTLVDSAEADPAGGKVSVVSPVGKAMVGCHTGDEVAVLAPKGERKYRIASVRF